MEPDRMHILFVEDDPDEVLLVRDMLREAATSGPHFSVTSATRLAEGLDHLRDKAFDAVLLDLSLPDSSGMETLAAMRASAGEVPIIVLTNSDDAGLGIKVVRAGAQAYLPKSSSSGTMLAYLVRHAVERHRLSARLEEQMDHTERSRKRLETVIRHNADALCIVGGDGTVCFVNPAAEAFFRQTAAELLGAPFPFPTEASREVVIDRDDAVTYGEMRTTRIDWESQRAYLVSIRDITERKEAQVKLQETNRQLEETLAELKATQEQMIRQERLRALGQMASGIAHDFNNALAIIIGYCDLLQFEMEAAGQEGGPVPEYIREITTAAKDASETVRRLREFYRKSDNSRPALPVKLDKLLKQSVALTQPKWKDEALGRGISIDCRTQLSTVPLVLANSAELKEVLTNLIFNAVEAMEADGSIVLRTVQEGDRAGFEVEDSGKGMTHEARERCFEPFYSTKRGLGTGLGLSVVHGIIKRNSGTIEVDSTPDAGTRFRILLPALKAPTRAREAEEARHPVPEPLRILVADDEPAVRRVLNQCLTRDGHAVVAVEDGPSAIEAADSDSIDLAILDKGMPGMCGEKAAQKLKSAHPDLPIIMLTGFGHLMQAQKHHPEGVDILLGKPVDRNALRKAIADAVDPPAAAADADTDPDSPVT